ncbi:TetR/AcrR family transcriptional regulator [Tistrella sp. 25B02-3]
MAAARCFWAQGYELTSIRDLVESTGITSASLYNAFGDKRGIYARALDHYVDRSIADRIRRCRELPPRAALDGFFDDILTRSLADPDHKGCMLVNAALEVAPHDPGFRRVVAQVLIQIETFFTDCIIAGQADGSITGALPARDLAAQLLGALIGVRTLARVRPEPELLKAIVRSALALVDRPSTAAA